MRERTLEVFEDTDKLFTLWSMEVTANRTIVPYNLDGSVVKFFIKDSPDDADPVSPLYASDTSGITILPAPPYDVNGNLLVGAPERNRFTLQTLKVNQSEPARKWYYIVSTKESLDTLLFVGPFIVLNR